MSIAIDANILVFRTNQASEHYPRAGELLNDLLAGDELVYLFWPTIVAYLRVVTVRGALQPPLSLSRAIENVGQLLDAPNVRYGSEGSDFWSLLTAVSRSAQARGKFIHDAHLVALMREHGVGTIWTNDRGFHRFQGIRVVDPFA